jgi:hypothetical protein
MLTRITTTIPLKGGVINSERIAAIDSGVAWLSILRSIDVIDLVITSCVFVVQTRVFPRLIS